MRPYAVIGSVVSVLSITAYILYPSSTKQKLVMYTFKKEQVDGDVEKYKVYLGEDRIKFNNVIQLLKDDERFRDELKHVLTDCPYPAYFFETPPVNNVDYSATEFEFVLVNSKTLANVSPNREAFLEHFKSDCSNVAFFNLGKDAKLIAPCPVASKSDKTFTHLTSFARNSDEKQYHDFWKLTAKEMDARVNKQGSKYTWLSTSGLGIYWLHMRIDSKPKYYTYQPYKTKKDDT